MGRFLSPDWSSKPENVPYADLENPQSLNLYSYVNNNPLSKADKDGHDPNDTYAAFGAAELIAPEATPLILGAAAAYGLYENRDSIVQGFQSLGNKKSSAFHSSDSSDSKPAPAAPASLPTNPSDLTGQGYNETSHPEAAAAGHRTFENPATGDKVRHDQGKPGAPRHEGTDHYHRYNPKSTGKGDQYLDANGKPVPRGSDASHLQPQPPPPPPPQPKQPE